MHKGLGKWSTNDGDYDDAIMHYEKAVKLYQRSVSSLLARPGYTDRIYTVLKADCVSTVSYII